MREEKLYKFIYTDIYSSKLFAQNKMWHRYFIMVNWVMVATVKLSKWWLQLKPIRTPCSVVSLLVVALYQGNHDRNHIRCPFSNTCITQTGTIPDIEYLEDCIVAPIILNLFCVRHSICNYSMLIHSTLKTKKWWFWLSVAISWHIRRSLTPHSIYFRL